MYFCEVVVSLYMYTVTPKNSDPGGRFFSHLVRFVHVLVLVCHFSVFFVFRKLVHKRLCSLFE